MISLSFTAPLLLLLLVALASGVAPPKCPEQSDAELAALLKAPIRSARFVSRPGRWAYSELEKGRHVAVELTTRRDASKWLVFLASDGSPVVSCAGAGGTTPSSMGDLPVRGVKTVGGVRAAVAADDFSTVESGCDVSRYKVATYLTE